MRMQDAAIHVVGVLRLAGRRPLREPNSIWGVFSRWCFPRVEVPGVFWGALGSLWGPVEFGDEAWQWRDTQGSRTRRVWAPLVWPGCARVSHWSIGCRHTGDSTVHSDRVQIPSACTALHVLETVSSTEHGTMDGKRNVRCGFLLSNSIFALLEGISC